MPMETTRRGGWRVYYDVQNVEHKLAEILICTQDDVILINHVANYGPNTATHTLCAYWAISGLCSILWTLSSSCSSSLRSCGARNKEYILLSAPQQEEHEQPEWKRRSIIVSRIEEQQQQPQRHRDNNFAS